MWPASALLTGNGVAFVLRVPGTEHGDWWSMNGWWIFAGTSAVALLSKYVDPRPRPPRLQPVELRPRPLLPRCSARSAPIRSRSGGGRCRRALVLALALIVVGGFLILRRLHLLGIAVGFWLAFAAGIGVLAASGHTMTAAWHVGPIAGRQFWWLLVSSPEILVFLFFMITDPKTIPDGLVGRRVVRRRGRTARDAADRAADDRVRDEGRRSSARSRSSARPDGARRARRPGADVGAARATRRRVPEPWPRARSGGATLVAALAFGALVFAAGIPARPDAGERAPRPAHGPASRDRGHQRGRRRVDRPGDGARRSPATSSRTSATESDALRSATTRSSRRPPPAGRGSRRCGRRCARRRPDDRRREYDVERMVMSLHRGTYQGPPTVVANLQGTLVASTYGRGPTFVSRRGSAALPANRRARARERPVS